MKSSDFAALRRKALQHPLYTLDQGGKPIKREHMMTLRDGSDWWTIGLTANL